MNVHHTSLYTKESVAAIDKAAIASGIPGYTLMRRAGAVLFDFLTNHFDSNHAVLVVCGAGNNAGDGYVLARLAKQQGWQVTVASVSDITQLKGDALQACMHWQEVGVVVDFDDANANKLLDDSDLIVDALFGTGLTRDVEAIWLRCIDAINLATVQSTKPVIAVDIPSGLNANTGSIQGAAINADYTVSFIGLKQGLFTASGKQCCGEILFDDLSVSDEIIQQQKCSAQLIDQSILQTLPPRRHDTHKGQFGHVLVVGGNKGMPGSVALTARAALKAGAGMVSVVTLAEHLAAITTVCPEAMIHVTPTGQIDENLLEQVTSCVIGPGLGQDAWANRLLYQVKQLDLPVLYDADALNLIALSKQLPTNACVITPHPGEAGRLLDVESAVIQNDRFAAVTNLSKSYATTAVLKGSGTLIADESGISVCENGSSAMSSAGMGDVLSGIIIALIAQGLTADEAARIGVVWHARAAELAAYGADRGVLASDVIDVLQSAQCEIG